MKIKLNKENPKEFINTLKSITKDKKVLFACVGTDRSTGDSLGPIVGTSLKELGYNVIGTLDEPLHAANLSERMSEAIQMDIDLVIAIDACLGRMDSIGDIVLKDSPLKPGAGVGKDLPEIGDYNIAGIVNVGGFMEYQVLQNTRLSKVMDMSKSITESIKLAVPISINENNIYEIHMEEKLSLFDRIKSLYCPRKIKLA